MEVDMDVPPRDLICRPLAALKDNRAEAEEHAAELCKVAHNGAVNGAPAAKYQPGLYLMMGWVASRLHKAGAAAWAFIFEVDELDCLLELAMFAA
jgi:hypothetical protein